VLTSLIGVMMRIRGTRNTAAKWARFALKAGLLLSDAKLWTSINEQLRDHLDDAGGAVRRGYESTTDRLEDARDALRGETHWPSHAMSFVGGVGLGVGLGLLFAPSSGEETRAVLRDKATDLRNMVGDVTGAFRTSPATGTHGD
jgi:YtxH-like protein